MKNVFILETNKPSRLVIDTIESKLYYQSILHKKTANVLPQKIYITNDERVRNGDWIIVEGHIVPQKCQGFMSNGDIECDNGLAYKKECCFKTVLTTDSDLIADGVQPLEDSFLEAFVSNVVDYVEVEKEWKGNGVLQGFDMGTFSTDGEWTYSVSFSAEKEVKTGRLYTKEDMMDFAIDVASYDNHSNPHKTVEEHFEEWFKYYIKK